MIIRRLPFLAAIYFFVLFAYSVFTYTFTDPNLVLTSFQPYWNFQVWMWQVFYSNRPLTSLVYTGLITALLVAYVLIYKQLKLQKPKISWMRQVGIMLLLISPLLISYNALSHDVFNYIFNARMVVEYQQNPHVTTALQFPDDLWTRFMHNTHTAAPYGQGWTALSLAPYILGMGRFLPTWLLFRIFMLVSYAALFFAVRYFHQLLYRKPLQAEKAALLFLNPLFAIEIISNMHNDLWMMVPAVFGLALMVKYNLAEEKEMDRRHLAMGIILILISIAVKLVTVVLLPLVLILLLLGFPAKNIQNNLVPAGSLINLELMIGSFKKWLVQFVPAAAAFLLLIPLFLEGSKRFHPWYLSWAFVFLPLLMFAPLKHILLIFSFSSLFRYLPWIYQNGYTNEVLVKQQLITWLPVILYLIIRLVNFSSNPGRYLRSLAGNKH